MLRGLLLVLLALLGLSTGCDGDRKPVPTLTIVVLAEPDQYTVNQQRMGLSGLEAELKRIADENRRQVTNSIRAYLYVHADAGVDYYRTQDVVNLATEMGYSNIVTHSAGPK